MSNRILHGFTTLLLGIASTWVSMALIKAIELFWDKTKDQSITSALNAVLSLPAVDWQIFLASMGITLFLFFSISSSRTALNDAIILLNAMGKNQSVKDRYLIGACRSFRSRLFRLPLYAAFLAGVGSQLGNWQDWSIRNTGGRWVGLFAAFVVILFLIFRMYLNLMAMQIAIDKVIPPDEVKSFLKQHGMYRGDA